jgi:hypothetical protein
MPIKMQQFEEGTTGPIIICVFCEKQITEHGNVLWRLDETDYTTIVAGPEFAHKDCDDLNDAHRRDQWPQWEELDAWLYYLVGNTRVDLDAARERTGWLYEDDALPDDDL